MYEKISDEKIRREKVSELKERILLEVNIKLSATKDAMMKDIKNLCFPIYIKTCFALLKLKEYLEDKNSFMDYEAKYPDKDIVIYTISDRNLDIWMQYAFPFIMTFLTKAKEVDYNMDLILTDKYFGYNFTSICEAILYDSRKQINEVI